jgi:hypothetical protein
VCIDDVTRIYYVCRQYLYDIRMPNSRTPIDEVIDLKKYVFGKKGSAEGATGRPKRSGGSLLPDETVCRVMNEHEGDVLLLDDVVVIHRDCGFLRQCSTRGWKTLYSADYIEAGGKSSGIQVLVCTYNYWLVGSFVCACAVAVALLVRAFEDTLYAVSAPPAHTEGQEEVGLDDAL